MNYYERHIGDYLKDTAHLSLLQHGVYARLMDVYYTREGPIPQADAARLIGARGKDERVALQAVLDEFFCLMDGNRHQDRCDREIARFKDKQRKAKASADARWSESGRNANASRSGDASVMRTHSEGNAPRARPQSPVSSNQNKGPPKGAPLPEWMPTEQWDAFVAMRKAKGKRAPFTDKAAEGIVAALDKLREAGYDVAQVLQASVINGWSGVFAPKVNGVGGHWQSAPPPVSKDADATQQYLAEQTLTPEQRAAADKARAAALGAVRRAA